MNGPVALVVDEENASRALLTSALVAFGVNVIEAGDIDAALAELRRSPVRLLFVDLQLPDGSAERLIDLARSYSPEYSLVVMTRRPSLKSAVEAVRMGACDYLVKPLTSDKIETACTRALAGRTVTPQSADSVPEALDLGVQPELSDVLIPRSESSNVGYGRRRFDAASPAEMTVNVPLVGDFRKITQCLVREALAKFRGNKAAAARALGMHRKTLYRLLREGATNTDEE